MPLALKMRKQEPRNVTWIIGQHAVRWFVSHRTAQVASASSRQLCMSCLVLRKRRAWLWVWKMFAWVGFQGDVTGPPP